jgi:hypothetical protein
MASINVNGERVYVPELKGELIEGLQHMGIYKIAGVPLQRVHMKELENEYRRARRACIERRQRKARAHQPPRRRPVQMILVPA